MRRVLAGLLALVLLGACGAPSLPRVPVPRVPVPHLPFHFGTTSSTATVESFLPEAMRFVEQHRGLRFKHPVKGEHLAGRDFDQRILQEQRRDRADTVRQGKVMRALHLVPPNVDVEQAEEKLLTADVIGVYDPTTKALAVRGQLATLDVKHVVVHELTHALQDQWFSIDTSQKHLDDDASLALSALVEGDAVRVEREYVASLPASDRRKLAQAASQAGSLPAEVPPVLEEMLSFPYVVGPRFVAAVLAARGQAGLDEAFRHWPATSSQVIHPERWLQGSAPATVDDPPADGAAFDHGKLGEFGFDLLLEELLGVSGVNQAQLRLAAQGMAGDRNSAWADGSRFCVRERILPDGAAAATAITRTLQAWAALHPGATVVPGDEPTLTSCA